MTNQILALDYQKEIISLNKGIAYCNEAICSKKSEAWEVKEFKAVKLEKMKRKIQLIKVLNNSSLWN